MYHRRPMGSAPPVTAVDPLSPTCRRDSFHQRVPELCDKTPAGPEVGCELGSAKCKNRRFYDTGKTLLYRLRKTGQFLHSHESADQWFNLNNFALALVLQTETALVTFDL